MILVIGSSALRKYGIHVNRRVLDIDAIANEEDAKFFIEAARCTDVVETDTHIYGKMNNGVMVEVEIARDGNTAETLLKILKENPSLVKTQELLSYAHPKVCLTLKLSHKYKKNSVHFMKTMRDIQMLQRMGLKVPKVLSSWLKERKRVTYDYKHPKLMGVKKEDFFSDDGIRYVYDHDAIHRVVKHLDKPAYRFFQPDGEEVGTSKSEFDKQSRLIQLLAVLEESYVLSLERAIIPYNLYGDEAACRRAFVTALSKVCTSITSGWFRKFAYDNFDTVMGMYDIEYVHRFRRATNFGLVALHNEENYHG